MSSNAQRKAASPHQATSFDLSMKRPLTNWHARNPWRDLKDGTHHPSLTAVAPDHVKPCWTGESSPVKRCWM